VPQVGDRVVYLQQGHKQYHERLRDKRRGPWDTIVSTAVSHTSLEPAVAVLCSDPFKHTALACAGDLCHPLQRFCLLYCRAENIEEQ